MSVVFVFVRSWGVSSGAPAGAVNIFVYSHPRDSFCQSKGKISLFNSYLLKEAMLLEKNTEKLKFL